MRILTQSEIKLMEQHKIRFVEDEGFKWRKKCKQDGCNIEFCFCSDDINVAVREITSDSDIYCCLHHPDTVKECTEEFNNMTPKERELSGSLTIEDFIFNKMSECDFDGDCGDYHYCDCDV